MKPFCLHINYHSSDLSRLSIQVQPGQFHLIQSGDTQESSNFFAWLEGKKYEPENLLELSIDEERVSDFLLLKKQFSIIRFQLNVNESNQFYYQQRYHATENEDVISVKDYLGDVNNDFERELINKFCLDNTLHEKVNMLSTGEFRKIFLLKHAFARNRILFIEDPFAGIDTDSRNELNELFIFLCKQGYAVIVVSCEQAENYPAHFVWEIKNRNALQKMAELNFIMPVLSEEIQDKEIVHLRNVSASYNDRQVLDRIDWKILKGEKWLLSGKNGAGKSTLLSFIYADNPQVYCNEVYLFGKKRGSGESIWDLKDQIGFYSSEFHRYFNKSLTVQESIRSIVFQNPYKPKNWRKDSEQFFKNLLSWFELSEKYGKTLFELSVTEQKLVLLVGVLVKNTPFLILDEPFQGFDENSILKARMVLDAYIQNRTFIMVTHKPEEVPKYVDKFFKLEKGKEISIS